MISMKKMVSSATLPGWTLAVVAIHDGVTNRFTSDIWCAVCIAAVMVISLAVASDYLNKLIRPITFKKMFCGRMCIEKFWGLFACTLVMFVLGVSAVCGGINALKDFRGNFFSFFIAYGLVVLGVVFAVGAYAVVWGAWIKRSHDINMSGWIPTIAVLFLGAITTICEMNKQESLGFLSRGQMLDSFVQQVGSGSDIEYALDNYGRAVGGKIVTANSCDKIEVACGVLWFVLFVVMGVVPGTKGRNDYGEEEKNS